jgi:hypothetical protein
MTVGEARIEARPCRLQAKCSAPPLGRLADQYHFRSQRRTRGRRRARTTPADSRSQRTRASRRGRPVTPAGSQPIRTRGLPDRVLPEPPPRNAPNLRPSPDPNASGTHSHAGTHTPGLDCRRGCDRRRRHAAPHLLLLRERYELIISRCARTSPLLLAIFAVAGIPVAATLAAKPRPVTSWTYALVDSVPGVETPSKCAATSTWSAACRSRGGTA